MTKVSIEKTLLGVKSESYLEKFEKRLAECMAERNSVARRLKCGEQKMKMQMSHFTLRLI